MNAKYSTSPGSSFSFGFTVHGLGGDPNPYAYVGGAVFDGVDPFGLDTTVLTGRPDGGDDYEVNPDPPRPQDAGMMNDRAAAVASVAAAVGQALWASTGVANLVAAAAARTNPKSRATQATTTRGVVAGAWNTIPGMNGSLSLPSLLLDRVPMAPENSVGYSAGGGFVQIAAVLAPAAAGAVAGRAVVGAAPGATGVGAAEGAGGTTTFFRGMTYGEALETVEGQGLSAPRIGANQALNPGAAGSGAYITSQAATAGYYADLAGLQGRGLGPAVVRIDVPTEQFNAFASRTGISVESAIPRGPFPGATETLIPMQHIGEFNGLCTFCLHR